MLRYPKKGKVWHEPTGVLMIPATVVLRGAEGGGRMGPSPISAVLQVDYSVSITGMQHCFFYL